MVHIRSNGIGNSGSFGHTGRGWLDFVLKKLTNLTTIACSQTCYMDPHSTPVKATSTLYLSSEQHHAYGFC